MACRSVEECVHCGKLCWLDDISAAELRGFAAGREAAAQAIEEPAIRYDSFESFARLIQKRIRALQPPAEVTGERCEFAGGKWEGGRLVGRHGDNCRCHIDGVIREIGQPQPPRAGAKRWVRTRLGEHELSSGCKVYEPDDVGDFEPGDAITIAPTADIDALVRLLREAHYAEATSVGWIHRAGALLATIDKENGNGT